MLRPALHQAVSADSEITLVVPAAPGEADGEEQWPGPCRGRQRLTQPLKRRRMPGAKPRSLDPPHVPWCPGTERDNTFKDSLRMWEGTTVEERQLEARTGPDYRGGDRERGQPHPSSATIGMATASTSGQSTFGLGRKKKNPGLMDQISSFFGGDKKKRSKVSTCF